MVSYRVKVRATTYLWGGASVSVPAKTNLSLHFRIDELGEPLRFGVRKRNGGPLEELGTLQPGECYSLQIDEVTGIYAVCAEPADCNVDCTIIGRND